MLWFLALFIIPGDAQRGAQVFETQKCVMCHAVNGKGGKAAPDLAQRSARAFTPSLLASLMWNHAPEMWSAIGKTGVERPVLSEQQAADLYAYFFAFRYFEQPGDAGRGKQVLDAKHCSDCHQTSGVGASGAPPFTAWPSSGDAIGLAREMWNHSPKMRDEFAKRKLNWPELNAQQLSDIMLYIRNLPGSKKSDPQFAPAAPETGASLFEVKGCKTCHTGALALDKGRLRGRTLTDLAVALWNHAPKMIQLPPEISDVEMRRLVGYLWSIQYFESPGSAARGAKVFASKKCGTCHGGTEGIAAPALSSKTKQLDPIGVVTGLWQHGPDMLGKMKERNLPWPRFRGTEMADLIAYVNSLH